MMPGARSLLAFAACLAPAGGAPDLASPDPGEVRQEYFVLEIRPPELPATDLRLKPPPSAREVGLACLRRRALGSGEGGGIQLECECLFLRDAGDGEPEHLLHVERLSGDGPRLVWREWGPGRARCLTAEWTADGRGLRMVESCRGGIPRETRAAGDGAVMPLYLLELAREASATSGRYRRIDPLSREIESVDLEISPPSAGAADVREVVLRREDKSLAGRYEFRGAELLSFQWQEGDLFARRVTAEEYAERRPRPASEHRP